MSEQYEFTTLDISAGGHLTLVPLDGGMVSLQSSGPSGRPGAVAMTTDEMQALIAALAKVSA